MNAISTQNMQLADWTRNIRQSSTQQMLNVSTQPDITSFSLGMPATEFFPSEAYSKAVNHVLATNPRALQYGPPWQPLKKHIVTLMKHRGIICREEQVFLTTGAQQGMNLLARMLLNVHGTVLLEELTYDGILQTIETLQPRILTVPTDPHTGIDVDAVEAILTRKERPAFLYTLSDGHNPIGVSMTLEKRQRLVELARQYRMPIIEDDAYGFLHYDKNPLPSLRALDPDWVFYLGTFSKIMVPALRVGWIIAPEAIVPVLSKVKEGTDVNIANFSQRTIAAYMDSEDIFSHIEFLRQRYCERRDAMIYALETHFPANIRWYRPSNGMFIWLEFPEEIDMSALLMEAITKEKVAFMPGSIFPAQNSSLAARGMRLTFPNCTPERIIDGIARLARVLPNTNISPS